MPNIEIAENDPPDGDRMGAILQTNYRQNYADLGLLRRKSG
jgi:hypothetical protein